MIHDPWFQAVPHTRGRAVLGHKRKRIAFNHSPTKRCERLRGVLDMLNPEWVVKAQEQLANASAEDLDR